MSPERETEFSSLLAYISFFATNVWRINPDADVHPARVVDRIAGVHGRSKALAGLRQAVNDTVEEASSWNAEARTKLDNALKDAGVMTLSEVSRRYASRYQRILKRGGIENETEYYLVNGILIDQTSQISSEERARVQVLVDAYEAR